MTAHEAKLGIIVSLFAVAGAILSAGVSWGTTQSQLKNTVSREEHVRDSIATASRIDALGVSNALQLRLLERIDQRVADMYCAGKPAGCR